MVSYGPNSSVKYVTTYFRKTFSIPDVNAYPGYSLRIKRDDGVILYVNGTEVFRQNFNEGSISSSTLAYAAVSESEEGKYLEALLKPNQFASGNNTFAVEIHQSSVSSSDISFDLDGVPSVGSRMPVGDHHIAVRHRNHLGPCRSLQRI